MDASDWMKGIFFSVLASIVGAGSKLAIRKSWLMEELPPVGQTAIHDDGDSTHSEYRESSAQASTISNPNEPSEGLHCSPSLDVSRKPQSSRRRADSRSYYTAFQSPPSSPAGNSSIDTDNVEETLGGSEDIMLEEQVLEIESTPIPKRCCTFPLFLRFCGMIGMTFINPAFSLLAMNYATPSILAPFSGLTLVWVIVLSRPLIGEAPSCAQKVASALIVIGEVMVAVFGDHSNDEGTTTADVVESYKEIPFIVYFVALAIWMLLLCIWMKFSKSPMLKRFAWGTSGGSITGLAQNFIKDSLVVVKAAPSLRQTPWFVFLFAFNGIAFSFGGLLFLTACMKRYDATYSAAMFVGSFVVSTSIMSAAHYHTFEHLADMIDYIMYPMGLVILMVGVYILVQATQAYNLVIDPDDSERIILRTGRHGDDEDGNTDNNVAPVAPPALREVSSKTTEITFAGNTPTESDNF